MDMGLSCFPYADWRWIDTHKRLHPSALLQTLHGWLMAAREEVFTPDCSLPTARARRVSLQKEWRTALFEVPTGHTIPRRLMTFPSGGDTGYAGLALGGEAETIIGSWYAQHETLEKGPYGTTLPGASVYVATVRISP